MKMILKRSPSISQLQFFSAFSVFFVLVLILSSYYNFLPLRAGMCDYSYVRIVRGLEYKKFDVNYISCLYSASSYFNPLTNDKLDQLKGSSIALSSLISSLGYPKILNDSGTGDAFWEFEGKKLTITVAGSLEDEEYIIEPEKLRIEGEEYSFSKDEFYAYPVRLKRL